MELNTLGLNKLPADTKVCVAMSGGVDSTAAAYLLKKQGYDVFGLTMDLLEPPYAPAYSSIGDAAVMAKKIGISHYFLDLKADFRRLVVDYFADSYLRGLTPSPCLKCNQSIKLGLLADKAVALGADIIVTGHYADVRLTPHGAELHKGRDERKDQSYFLFNIRKEILSKFRCPLAEYSKEETRRLAAEAGLEVAAKPDSQDICFVAEGKYSELIARLRPEVTDVPGEIVHVDGRILGQHKGIIHYTVGQRRGLGIGGGDILYVTAIDAVRNRIIVGPQNALFSRRVEVAAVNWLAEEQPQTAELSVKLRSRQQEVPATVTFAKGQAVVTLHNDFAAVAPGQGCCFYQGSRVMGGGIIVKSE